MKVTVRIHTDHGLEFRKKKVEPGNKIRMRKKPLWETVLKDFEVKQKWFGRVQYYCDVWEDAPATWIYNSKVDTKDQAKWDKSHEEELFRAAVVKAAGASTQKLEIPMALYLMIGVTIILGIVGLLVSTGRLRL